MFALIWKDALLEARRRETILSLFVLGLLILLIFNFAIDVQPDTRLQLAPGLLWVAIVFAGMLGLGRTFLVEKENSCMTGLLLSPIDRGSLFLAKFAVNFLLMTVFEIMIVPVFLLLFDIPTSGIALRLAAVIAAGTIGLAATGTLFALAAIGTRARELMLPLLVLPLQIPLIIAAVKATELVFAGQPLTALGSWATILGCFDVLFVTFGWIAFEFLTVD